MRKLEGVVKEIVDELEYLKKREERFADTNRQFSLDSCTLLLMNFLFLAVVTNRRVQNFAWFTILALAALGVWQILHLRSFFKRKYLID
jgi:hypothetical protein